MSLSYFFYLIVTMRRDTGSPNCWRGDRRPHFQPFPHLIAIEEHI